MSLHNGYSVFYPHIVIAAYVFLRSSLICALTFTIHVDFCLLILEFSVFFIDKEGIYSLWPFWMLRSSGKHADSNDQSQAHSIKDAETGEILPYSLLNDKVH